MTLRQVYLSMKVIHKNKCVAARQPIIQSAPQMQYNAFVKYINVIHNSLLDTATNAIPLQTDKKHRTCTLYFLFFFTIGCLQLYIKH